MSIKAHIPNAITLANLFCGCVAVYFACTNQMLFAAIFCFLGIFLDFFDGFFARLLQVQSELGLQLDSLADMVTSGVVPGVFMFQMLRNSSAISDVFDDSVNMNSSGMEFVAFFGFAISIASCYRLAKFNLDTRQTTAFIGLPTPANTLLIISLSLASYYGNFSGITQVLSNTWALLGITAVSCYFLNAEIHLFALKFKTWNLKDNWMRYALIIGGIFFISIFGYLGICLTIVGYMLLSLALKKIPVQ